MVWVGVLNDRPQEVVWVLPEGVVSDGFNWVEVDEELAPFVNGDYIVEGNKVVPPSKDYFITQLKHDLATTRYISQNYFVTYNGNEFSTNSATRSVIDSRILEGQLQNTETYALNFKARNGNVIMSYTDLVNVKLLVAAHIQACFDREAEISELLDTKIGKLKSYTKMVSEFIKECSTGWPLPEKVEGHY